MPFVPPISSDSQLPWQSAWTMLVDNTRATAISKEAAFGMARDPMSAPFAEHQVPVSCTYVDRGPDAPATPERYRIRRLGLGQRVALENKRAVDGRVCVRTAELDGCDAEMMLGAEGLVTTSGTTLAEILANEMRVLELVPHFEVTFTREAFSMPGLCAHLTIDRRICLRGGDAWLPRLDPSGRPLGTTAVVTMRFLEHPPALFRRLMQTWHLIPRSYSKYLAGREAQSRMRPSN